MYAYSYRFMVISAYILLALQGHITLSIPFTDTFIRNIK